MSVPPVSPPSRSVILCTTPRSGSTMLCTLLRQVAGAGRPESWFRAQDRAEFAVEWGLPPDPPFADFLAAAITAGKGPDGTFGLRLMANTLSEVLSDLAALLGPGNDLALMERAFGPIRWLRLRRLDTVAQAVSLYRAEASGLWHRNGDGSPMELFGDRPRAVVYDAKAIAGYLTEIEDLNAAWDDWFDRMGITPVPLFYENLASDPDASLSRALGALGIAAQDQPLPKAGTARLADATSADWAARFRTDAREMGGLNAL